MEVHNVCEEVKTVAETVQELVMTVAVCILLLHKACCVAGHVLQMAEAGSVLVVHHIFAVHILVVPSVLQQEVGSWHQ